MLVVHHITRIIKSFIIDKSNFKKSGNRWRPSQGQIGTRGFWKWDKGEERTRRGKETKSSHPAGKNNVADRVMPRTASPRAVRQTLQRRETNQRSLVHPQPSHSSSPPFCVAPNSPQKCWCSAVLHTEATTTSSCTVHYPSRRVHKRKELRHIIQPWQEVRSLRDVQLQPGDETWWALGSHQEDNDRTCRYAELDNKKPLKFITH